MESINLNQEIRPVYHLLKVTFGIVPIVAGFDKFTNLLTNWEKYIHPGIESLLPFSPHIFMMITGVIEMAAGIMVLIKPAIGGLVVAAWLTLIALTLLAGGNFLDVAVRDLMMAIGAFSLARIAKYVS
jgi:hypothetical protein